MKNCLSVLILCSPFIAHANPDVTSREYKLMLDANQFNYDTEANNVKDFLDDAETEIENSISRNVIGNEYHAKTRDVKFYDTEGTCELNTRGYSFRERIENTDSEVTLKFRSPDRYISDFKDLSAISSQAETKLEADVGVSSTSTFKVVYGHSTKAPNTRNINRMDDINDQFPGFSDDYDLDDSLTLDLVGDLTVREHVYKGRVIDLGQYDAEISVTLWYNGMPSGSQAPVVAEVSFKYEDNSADYTKKVVNRAKTAFESLQSLTSWTNPASKTKTRFVYEFDASFCL